MSIENPTRTRRQAFKRAAITVAMLAGAAVAHPALAQKDYPEKPIRLIVPFPPGGGTDIIARLIGDKVNSSLGWRVIIDNKPGAGGTLGMDAAAKSKPDGYTVALGQTANLSIAPSLYPKLGYDPVKAFAPITLVDSVPLVVVVAVDSKFQSIRNLVDTSKSAPGDVLFASPGNGTVAHLAGELFQRTAGIKYTHVPYKGASQALPDLIGGRVAFFVSSLENALQPIKTKQVRPIAVTSTSRTRSLPDVPTFAESGYPGFEAATWFGFVAPAGTPTPIIERLNVEIEKILKSPEVKARLTSDVPFGPAAFAKTISADIEKWGKIVREAGVKAE